MRINRTAKEAGGLVDSLRGLAKKKGVLTVLTTLLLGTVAASQASAQDSSPSTNLTDAATAIIDAQRETQQGNNQRITP